MRRGFGRCCRLGGAGLPRFPDTAAQFFRRGPVPRNGVGIRHGPQQRLQQVFHFRFGRGQEALAPLLRLMEARGVGRGRVPPGGQSRAQGPGIGFAHQAADILHLPAAALMIADAGVQSQGFPQVRRQVKMMQFRRGQAGQLLAQSLKGQTLAFFGRTAGGFRIVRIAARLPLIIFFTGHDDSGQM